jgi:hypothetical protein
VSINISRWPGRASLAVRDGEVEDLRDGGEHQHSIACTAYVSQVDPKKQRLRSTVQSNTPKPHCHLH